MIFSWIFGVFEFKRSYEAPNLAIKPDKNILDWQIHFH